MFFRNLQFYRLATPFPLSLASFEEQLQRGAFVPCPSNEPKSRGWVPPNDSGLLVFASNNQWLIALRTEERLLPASVVADEVKERAEKEAAACGYKIGRKALRELKDRVVDELLPRAFRRKKTTHAWIDPIHGWLAVDASSSARAEEVIEQLRWCLDALPVSIVRTARSPASVMFGWLAGEEPPHGLAVDRDCELQQHAEEKSTVRYVRHALEGDDIKAHLAAGKLPTRLALTWADRISFVLTEKAEVKRLAFLDVLKEEAANDATCAAEQFEADFVIMTAELSRFLPELIAALGGEEMEEVAA